MDIKSLFQSIPSQATAVAIATAMIPLLGTMPEIINYGSYSVVRLTPGQEDIFTEWVLTQLRKDPGPVRLEMGAVALRVLSRQYWSWFAATLAVGFLAGRYGGR